MQIRLPLRNATSFLMASSSNSTPGSVFARLRRLDCQSSSLLASPFGASSCSSGLKSAASAFSQADACVAPPCSISSAMSAPSSPGGCTMRTPAPCLSRCAPRSRMAIRPGSSASATSRTRRQCSGEKSVFRQACAPPSQVVTTTLREKALTTASAHFSPSTTMTCCSGSASWQWQPKISHFWQSKITHFERAVAPPDAVLGVSDSV